MHPTAFPYYVDDFGACKLVKRRVFRKFKCKYKPLFVSYERKRNAFGDVSIKGKLRDNDTVL